MAASPDLDDERAELVGVLREAIERDRSAGVLDRGGL